MTEKHYADVINAAKYKKLKEMLATQGNKDPTRQDVQNILDIGYCQAYNYLKRWRDENQKEVA